MQSEFDISYRKIETLDAALLRLSRLSEKDGRKFRGVIFLTARIKSACTLADVDALLSRTPSQNTGWVARTC